MPDVNPDTAILPKGGPGVPIFIPISLTANVSEITVGTTVDFAFVVDPLPSNPTYSIGFYSTQSQPEPPTNSVGGHTHEDLPMSPLPVSSLPEVVPTADGGEFSFTFDSSSLPSSPAMVIITIAIAGEQSLGLCSLSYS